jgi:hypothetical protein
MMAQGQRRAFWQQLLAVRLKRKHSCRNASVSTNHMANLGNQLPHHIFQNCVHGLFLENMLIPLKKKNKPKLIQIFTIKNIFPFYSYMIVSISTTLFMPEAQCVH